MIYYAEGIRKFEREPNIAVTDFPQFGLVGRKMPHEKDSEKYFGNSCAQTQRELEDYHLQQQEQDDYRIQTRTRSIEGTRGILQMDAPGVLDPGYNVYRINISISEE